MYTLTYFNFTRAGVGSKKGRDDGWIEHQDAFDDILAQLNKQQGT